LEGHGQACFCDAFVRDWAGAIVGVMTFIEALSLAMAAAARQDVRHGDDNLYGHPLSRLR
jgi:hypothetical protein